LPIEVVQLLGRTPLADRQYVHLIRFGNKLLLIAVSAAGAETLAEISDPAEVDRLAGLCQQLDTNSTSATFRHVLQQFARERPAGGFVDRGDGPPLRPAFERQAAGEPSHG
jgi:flagellar biogenesis protein FliO